MGSGIGPDSVGDGDGWRRVRSSTGPRETGGGPDSDRVGGGQGELATRGQVHRGQKMKERGRLGRKTGPWGLVEVFGV